MGLRRRVTVGFMSIVGVLLLSGMISFYELNALSVGTENILGMNREYRDLSDRMFSDLRAQNRSFVQISAFGDESYDSLALEAGVRLDATLQYARKESQVPDVVDSLLSIAQKMNSIIEMTIASREIEVDSLDLDLDYSPREPRELYMEYMTLYDKIIVGVDRYYIDSQSSLAPGTEQLHNNAYRAVTPVLISLMVMIAIVLMLFYFIMTYCVIPVVKMNSSLKDWLAYKVPFAPKGERRDQMQELCERIETLIKLQSKSTKE